jgi:hypothetical protein
MVGFGSSFAYCTILRELMVKGRLDLRALRCSSTCLEGGESLSGLGKLAVWLELKSVLSGH